MSGTAGNKNDRNPISGSAAKGTTEIQLLLPLQCNTLPAHRRGNMFSRDCTAFQLGAGRQIAYLYAA